LNQDTCVLGRSLAFLPTKNKEENQMRAIKKWVVCCLVAAFIWIGAPEVVSRKSDDITFQVEASCKAPCIPVGAMVGPINAEMADGLEKFLASAKKSKAVAVVIGIASPGGDFMASKRIFDTIKASPVPVHCYVQGMAASGAFWALQACTTRNVDPKAVLMAHTPRATFHGTVVVNKAAAYFLLEQLISREAQMVHDLAPRMEMEESAMIQKFNEGDWVMTPEEAVAAKAIDSIESKGFGSYLETVTSKYRNQKWRRN
jgi:ATP-dependent protease ClpP protease subunit